jgi:hypothetical protein
VPDELIGAIEARHALQVKLTQARRRDRAGWRPWPAGTGVASWRLMDEEGARPDGLGACAYPGSSPASRGSAAQALSMHACRECQLGGRQLAQAAASTSADPRQLRRLVAALRPGLRRRSCAVR